MQKLKNLLPLCLLMLFILGGCTANKPVTVARRYFHALEKGKYKKASKYVAEEYRDRFEQLFSSQTEPDTYTITRYEIAEKTATVYYTTGSDNSEQSLKLEKRDGKWVIILTKF